MAQQMEMFEEYQVQNREVSIKCDGCVQIKARKENPEKELFEVGKEKCQRCGKIDYDRRNLNMACFYEMDELKIPFSHVRISGKRQHQVGEAHARCLGYNVPVFETAEQSEVEHRWDFYELRVCKDCRGDWLDAIRNWWNTSKTVVD